MSKRVLVIDPDIITGKCIIDELKVRGLKAVLVTDADKAIEVADSFNPSAVVGELSLPGHSGTEFLYEFRTYPDWFEVPVVIYSTIKLPKEITETHDWRLLDVSSVYYKPDISLETLAKRVEALMP